MLASFLITFRETLEAALIVGIILAFLSKTKNTKFNNTVYIGVGAGIFASVVVALTFNLLAGGFTGRAEEIFEGAAMLTGALLLTSMIFWMLNKKHIAHELREKVSHEIQNKDKFGLFFLSFISILREGVETVIFLGAARFATGSSSIIGGLVGVGIAMILGYLIFVASVKIDIKRFFNISSVLLILFAAGLTAHGVHEFQEAGLLPAIKENVWDINPDAPFSDQGIYPIFHENGVIGSFAKGLFGYNANPTLIEVIAYLGYLILVAGYVSRVRIKIYARRVANNLLSI